MNQTSKNRHPIRPIYAGIVGILGLVVLGFVAGPIAVAIGLVMLLALSAPLMAWYRRADTGIVGPE